MAIDTIRCCISKCGLPILDDQSRPLYGGHSLRTGGAVALASMGVDATRIEAMARWKSPMLLHYIKSAPLKSITKEYKLCKASSSNEHVAPAVGGVQKAIVALMARLDQSESSQATWMARFDALEEANFPKQHVLNIASGIWHLSFTHKAGQACSTHCGWHYTGAAIEASARLPSGIGHQSICGTCLPAARLLASCD